MIDSGINMDDAFLHFMKYRGVENKRSGNGAIIYTRVSSPDQMLNASIDTQKRLCTEYAENKGYPIIDYFGETSESAKTDERDEFLRMVAYAKKNRKVRYILVYAIDRFSRTGIGGAAISDTLSKLGVILISITQGVDSSTPHGQFHQSIFFVFSQYDNEMRRQRTVTGLRERLKQGYWPFEMPRGYKNLNKGQRSNLHKIVADKEGKILRKAWEWKIKELLPNKDIVKRLKGMGIKWINERRLSDVFRNPFYCGKLVNRLLGEEVVIGKHEALVSPDDFLMVNEILKGKFQKSKLSIENTVQLPLKRFMCCSDCGKPTTGYLQKQKNLFYYKCRTNGCKNNRSQKKLHLQFQEYLKRYEVKKESAEHIKKGLTYMFEQFNQDAKTEEKKYQKNLKDINQKIEQFELRFVEGEINKVLYEKYNQKFLEEKQQIEQIMDCSTFESSNLEKCIEYVSTLSQNLTDTWTSDNYSQSESVQQLLFPDGICYDFKNEEFLTSRINSLFLPIPYLSKGLEETKKRNNNKDAIDSALVSHTGFEPVTPSLSS